MYKYLPNGSVVLLKNTDHRIMTYGRFQKEKSSGKVYDYAGCYYPEGIQDSNEVLLFNAEDINLVFFVGYQDVDEFAYRAALHKAIEEKKSVE